MLVRGRPEGWTLITAASVLAATVLLLWACDGLSRLGAQSLVARAVQQHTGVTDKPAVHVHGRLFVPQVVDGNYANVDINIRGITSGPLRIDRVQANLSGVHVRFHDVLVRDVRSLLIDRSSERAHITYADLNRYLSATGRPVRLTGRTDRQLHLTGTVTVLGKRISATASVAVSAREDSLMLVPTALETGVTTLDAAVRILLRQRFTVVVPLQALPFGQHVTAIEAGPDALLVRAEGRAVFITT